MMIIMRGWEKVGNWFIGYRWLLIDRDGMVVAKILPDAGSWRAYYKHIGENFIYVEDAKKFVEKKVVEGV